MYWLCCIGVISIVQVAPEGGQGTLTVVCTTILSAIGLVTYLLKRRDDRRSDEKQERIAAQLAEKVETTSHKSQENQQIVKEELQTNTHITEEVRQAINGRWEQFNLGYESTRAELKTLREEVAKSHEREAAMQCQMDAMTKVQERMTAQAEVVLSSLNLQELVNEGIRKRGQS